MNLVSSMLFFRTHRILLMFPLCIKLVLGTPNYNLFSKKKFCTRILSKDKTRCFNRVHVPHDNQSYTDNRGWPGGRTHWGSCPIISAHLL